MTGIDPIMLWGVLIYGFAVQVLAIELVREERHGSFRLNNGKVETFSASAAVGVLWWFVVIGAMWCTLESLEKNDQTALMILLMAGSAFATLALSEATTQIISRKLFKDVQFASFTEALRG